MLPRNHELYRQNSENLNCRSERRQWDKTNPLPDLEQNDFEKVQMNKKRYDEYLVKLHTNNQLTRMNSRKDEKDEKLEKLEAGFCIYLNGAHRKTERYTLRHTVFKRSDKQNHRFVNNDKKNKPLLKTKRRTWANSSFTIKTIDGYEIKINAPEPEEAKKNDENIKEFHQENETIEEEEEKSSDSFESDDEDDILSDRKIVVELTPKDARSIRRSMTIMDGDHLKRRLEMQIEEDETETKQEEEQSESKEQVSIPQVDVENICEIILSKVANLKPEDRLNLINFLTQIEQNSKQQSSEQQPIQN